MLANGMQLGKNVKTIGELISARGVKSGYIGKWHLDGGDYFGNGKCPDGYDPEYWYDMRNYLDELPDEEARKRSRANMSTIVFGDVREEDTYAYRCTERAIKYIESHKNEDFFMTLSYDEPHDPSQCPKKYVNDLKKLGYKLTDKPNTNAKQINKPYTQKLWHDAFKVPWMLLKAGFSNGFLPCNYFVDSQIGKVLNRIEKLDNPLIIYTADHGDMLNSHGLMAKGPAMYNEITNVPLIIKGDIFKNRYITTPVSHIELLPTILDYFGIKKPKTLEGESLYKLENDNTTRNVFMQFNRFELGVDGYLGFQPIRAVVDGKYKLNINLFATDELYNLEEDPYELVNLIDDEKFKKIRNKLHDAILNHQNSIIDPLRGYQWACRPWRSEKKPSFENDGYVREKYFTDIDHLDYATGNRVDGDFRKKGMK